MSWIRRAGCRMDAWQAARTAWKADMEQFKHDRRTAKKAGKTPEHEHVGPPPTGFALLPWLLMGMGAFSNLFQDKTANPWIGGLGLLSFNSLYIYVVFRVFAKELREARSTRLALALMTVVTCGLAIGYGGNWLLFFPLLGLAVGATLRGPWLGRTGLGLSALAGVVAGFRDGWGAVNIAYGTFLSAMVTAAILSLSEAVRELREAREELARRAVEKERLRFSRDLHDLLGHTLSVIVVKSEAARRLAHRDLTAALVQITDIESVGRQALTEIREAVTGYREGSLATELDRARSALSAAGVEPVVRQSGTPLGPQTEALLGWVVREAVTNVLRHSDATRCGITVDGTPERVRLRITDNGTDRRVGNGTGNSGTGTSTGSGHGHGSGTAYGHIVDGIGGTGLKGLTERLATAGGSLGAGPGPRGGFVVTAELPVESADLMEPIALRA
ncbi:MAG: two-component system, NarL family, sensor histidine kinase DesK [Streptomyces sp.]|nr:two-component system, NarL family, sensor histidine kinase DesK [Streptomyces sp.]